MLLLTPFSFYQKFDGMMELDGAGSGEVVKLIACCEASDFTSFIVRYGEESPTANSTKGTWSNGGDLATEAGSTGCWTAKLHVDMAGYWYAKTETAPSGYKWQLAANRDSAGKIVWEDCDSNMISCRKYLTTDQKGNYTLVLRLVKDSDVRQNVEIASDVVDGWGVVLYLMQNNVVVSQFVAEPNNPIKLTQTVGDSYVILVGKPYMWTLEVSGNCAQNADNENRIDYTVVDGVTKISLTIRGGASSSVIVI